VLEVPQRVHLVLGIALVIGERAREVRAPDAPVGLGEQDARVEQLVEQDRMRGELGLPRLPSTGRTRQRRVLDQ
jgi:hypothetical protein